MKKALLSTLGAIGVAAALVGCGGTESSSSQSVSISGSTSVTEVMELLAETWQQQHPGAVVEVQGTGSSAGIKAANNGTSEIGMSSRPVKTEEEKGGVNQKVLAHDGIAVVVNNANGVSDLSKEQIASVFKGEITNWKALGGSNNPIVVVTRDPASGTRGAFEDIMKLKIKDVSGNKLSAVTASAQVASGNGVVKTIVAQNKYAIGYISLGTVDNTLKPLAVDGVQPSIQAIANGEYTVSRPFVLLFNEQKLSETGKDYLDWMLSAEGQRIVSEHGYIPVI
ncbi:phosphate ABC transporter substrate-binding protein [Endozoicomonas sp. Mp262]|uniref:phosphate ABC transporter substrate-binding protein n=1 Tax=Endozoicomonas sp. Mp262 TaxID=2919499 RepID=UPI0021D91557